MKSIGRSAREWMYAILDNGVGLPESMDTESGEPTEPDEDEDELIDVVEEDSSDSDDGLPNDPLAPLRGALERLGDSVPPAASVTSSVARKPR